jgi:hypothetical protein
VREDGNDHGHKLALALELERQVARRRGGAARAERDQWKAASKEMRRLSRARRR